MKELQFIIYNTPQEDVRVEAVVKDETLWLTQKAMAELFGVKVPAISKHLKNIFEEGDSCFFDISSVEALTVYTILDVGMLPNDKPYKPIPSRHIS